MSGILSTYPGTSFITALALYEYIGFGIVVGAGRAKFGVMAPATSGHPEFERRFRVHYNTLEQLPVFLTFLWLFSDTFGDNMGASIGAVWVVSRMLFALGYYKDPKKRELGSIVGFLATSALGLPVLFKAGVATLQKFF